MRILLIEDHIASAAAVTAGLGRSPVLYKIVHCMTLHAATERLKTDAFDAALVDLGLPDAIGTEAVTAVKSIAPWLPVVVITGEDFEGLAPVLMRHGIQDYLQKGDVSFARVDQSLRLACERQRHEDELKKLAAYDPLTGLANRSELNRQLDRALGSAQRLGTRVAVMAIDLDGFKQINDCHGHRIGDIVLQKSAERLLHWTRASDCAARIGGDEFVVVLESLHEPKAVASIAGDICAHLSEPVRHNGAEYRISASIGIALYPDHGIDAVRLCELADQAMYSIKRNGKGAAQVYLPQLRCHG